jgi:hypothetical protein
MDSWPGALQQKLNVQSFSVKVGNTLIRSEMDVGPAKVRSRYTDGIDVYTCSINITFDEYATLMTFFKTTLNNGSEQFLFNDPFTATPTAFRFTGPPTINPIGGEYFEVNMEWEKLP